MKTKSPYSPKMTEGSFACSVEASASDSNRIHPEAFVSCLVHFSKSVSPLFTVAKVYILSILFFQTGKKIIGFSFKLELCEQAEIERSGFAAGIFLFFFFEAGVRNLFFL